MNTKNIKENASAGASSAGSIATVVGGLGVGFGGNPNASIYGSIKKHRKNRKKKDVEEKKSNKAPATLRGKDKVAGDSILGHPEKKNKTLTTKFFGGCSANNDPGNKDVLAEIDSPVPEPITFGPTLQEEMMEKMWEELDHIKPSKITAKDVLKVAHKLSYANYAPRIRDRMTEVLNTWFITRKDGLAKYQKPKHNVELTLADEMKLARTEKLVVLEQMKKEFSGRPLRFITFEDIIKISNKLASYWNLTTESKKKALVYAKWFLKEGINTSAKPLSYTEFRNATHAVEKNCPHCGNSFKTIHDANQKFCCKGCEDKGTTAEKLKEAWIRPMQTEFQTKDGKTIGLEDVARLVNRVMKDSNGSMGRMAACVFVSGMLKNCTGWTIVFALEDYAKNKADQMHMLDKLES